MKGLSIGSKRSSKKDGTPVTEGNGSEVAEVNNSPGPVDVSDSTAGPAASSVAAAASATDTAAASAASPTTSSNGARPKAGFTTAGSALEVTDGDGTGFSLRIGPDYKKDKKKAPSLPHIYAPLAVDVFKRDAAAFHVASHLTLPPPPDGEDTPNATGLPRRLIVSAIVPVGGPPLLGGSSDGACYQVVVVFGATAEALAAWKAEASPAYCLFERFVKNAPEGLLPSDGDLDIKERLKLLPRLDNMSSLGLPGWIQGYNGKPALITKSGAIYRGADYLEVDMNTFRFGKMTRMGVHQLMPRIKDFHFHCALTVEGREESELPERTLCAVRLTGLNLEEIASTAELCGA